MRAQHLKIENSFEALAEIALRINTIHEGDALLNNVLEIAMDVLDAERGFILLLKKKREKAFDVRVSRNMSEHQVGEIVRISSGVVRTVLASGEPVLLYEAMKDDRFGSNESIVVTQIQSIACVPLRIKEKLIGAIYLDSLTRRGRFQPGSLPFLNAFANQAAVAIENADLYSRLKQENRHLRSEVTRAAGFSEIVGNSPLMRDVFELMARVIDTDATVLICGESGTGKELVARAIHYNGDRQDNPFVAVFCGSLPDELLESELFGHKKGAFTGAITDKKGLFEVASGGTIFLDEVGELSHKMQTSLLRVLQEGEIKRVGDTEVTSVDVRVLSATNKSLPELVKEGEFREDLFYRLNTIEIAVPPLRKRRGDIDLLADHFLAKLALKNRSHIRGFDHEARRRLQSYEWPGNVRELENAVERAVVLCRQDLITTEELRLPDHNPSPVEPGITLKELERRVVKQTLQECDGNVSETARVLGVSRRWLHYRLKEWESPDT